MSASQTITLAEVEQITRDALSACGASGAQLEIATQSVVDAECDGIRAVGLNYLPIYCGHLQHNKLKGDALPKHDQIAPSAIRSDAGNGFAHTAFVEAEQDFYELARQQGIAALTIVNSYSAGVVGWFVERMAKSGLMGLGFANSPSAVAPAPGAGAFFGTNPMAFAIPRTGKPPVVADMATSQVAFVTIKQHAASGEPIPLGWGYDKHGQFTEDASAVVNGGSLAPVGGYKGMLLGLLVDVLAGVLAGPNCSFNAPMFKNNEGTHPAVGQFFLAISPDSFSPDAPDQFGTRLELMLKALAQEPGVRLPGDRRHDFRRKAENDGVQIPTELYAKLKGLASG
ncbi:MAG: Ldh family oxidoreductase [Arenicellales bacterium WSBS_2016_MAG_OTU3]